MAAKKTEEIAPPPVSAAVTSQQIAEAQALLSNVPAQLPPEHIDHAAVLFNELALRKQLFEQGLAAIDAEILGKGLDREEQIAAIERDYKSAMASLDRRRTMMTIGLEMLGAGLDRYPSPEGQQNLEEQDRDADQDHGNT